MLSGAAGVGWFVDGEAVQGHCGDEIPSSEGAGPPVEDVPERLLVDECLPIGAAAENAADVGDGRKADDGENQRIEQKGWEAVVDLARPQPGDESVVGELRGEKQG